MSNKRRIFIYTAIVGLLAALALTFLNVGQRETLIESSDETTQAVTSIVADRVPRQVSTATDPELVGSVESLTTQPYIAWAWLADANGNLIVHEGGPGEKGGNLRDYDAHNEAIAYVNGLASEPLSPEEQLQMVALGAMRSEGEHNDVFRQAVFPVRDAQNNTQAVVVVAYDASPSLANPGSAYLLGLLGWIAAMAVYWLSLPLWVFFDARARGESASLWSLFVLFTNLVGLLAYLIGASRPAR